MTQWKKKSYEEILACLETGILTQSELCKLGRECVYSDIRKEAVRKITDQNVLAEIASYDESYEVFKMAIDRIFEESFLEKVVSHASDKYACSLAVRKIEDADTLLKIAKTHIYTEVRIEALHNLNRPDLLLQIAQKNSDSDVRAAAINKLPSQLEIARIATWDEDPVVYRAAIKAMTDPERLAEIALENVGKIKGTIALYRLRELSHKINIDRGVVYSLFPLFRTQNAIVIVIGLMEKAGVNWFSLCDLDTVEVLRREYSVSDPQNSQFIEQCVKSLYTHRPDLRDYLQAKEWMTPCEEDSATGARAMRKLVFFQGT